MARQYNLPGQTVHSTDTTGSVQDGVPRQGSGRTGQALRKQAEEIFKGQTTTSQGNLEEMSSGEMSKIIHELQVHQIELELQNEELHRIQAELEASRTRYFDLYDLAPVGYCTISKEGFILEANLAAANLLGVARSKLLVRQLITGFILREDQDVYYLHRKLLEDTGEPQACELRMKKKDGTEFWARLEAAAAEDTDGAPVYRVMLNDIAERRQAEAQRLILEGQTRQIQKAESLERMAGAIAHLFNNQLCVVLGNIEIALYELAEDAAIRENLVDALQSARRSSEVSGLLLTYLGQSGDQLEPLDLSEVCRSYLPELQAVMPSGIVLDTAFMSPGPVVRANANQMQQILSQLLINGWEAIGDGPGRITVTTKNIPASHLPTSHVFPPEFRHTAENFALLEVTDTGCGMTTEKMDRIFDPFYSTKFTGRGLGLAVAMGTVKAWGGMIDVESAVGVGSTLRVFLPLNEEVTPRRMQMPEEPAPWNCKAGWTVLLVDDDDIVRSVVESSLQRLGVTVFTAGNGPEAIAVFQRHQNSIHCLITDFCMPDMDGWETLATLRKICPKLPVILSSGYTETEVMSGHHTELPQAFLHKPYGLNELKKVLSRVLLGKWRSDEDM